MDLCGARGLLVRGAIVACNSNLKSEHVRRDYRPTIKAVQAVLLPLLDMVKKLCAVDEAKRRHFSFSDKPS